MRSRTTGQVIPPKNGRAWALRFRAYGKRRYVTLGSAEEGWNRDRAEAELRHVLADVERGTWRPYDPEPVEAPAEVPTFHEFASEWFEANKAGWASRTVKDYQDTLSGHVLPFFANHRLDAIDAREVDRFKAAKLHEGRLAPAQINKCLKRLSQILEVAEEYELINRNPARGKRRRVKAPKPQRTWVEPEQLPTLIEAADTYLRPILATLAGAGLRNGEAVALDARDVNLATATLTTGRAKTDAGSWREVDLPGGVVEALTEWLAFRSVSPSDPLFVTRRGRRQPVTGVAQRLKGAIKAANVQLAELRIEPISERVTPHSLRRTYASLRAACGDDPVYIAQQLGHEDARFTLAVYAKAVKRRVKLSGVYLAEFDRALAWATLPDWAATGSGADSEADRLSDVHSDMA